jgi:hypothetical protein
MPQSHLFPFYRLLWYYLDVMKRYLHTQRFLWAGLAALCAPFCAWSTAADAAPVPFSKYQTILDRMPFGALPANFGQAPVAAPLQTDAATQAEQQKLAQQINMSCINVTPDGSTAIGFTDLGAKPPVNFYLLVGAAAGGWTVVDADYDLEVAIIEKDGVRINLRLGKGLIDAQSLQDLIAQKDSTPPRVAAQFKNEADIRASDNRLVAQNSSHLRLEEADTKSDLGSYIERLRDRKLKERADKIASELATTARLQDLARTITHEEIQKRDTLTQTHIVDPDVVPLAEIETPTDSDHVQENTSP